MSVFLAAVGQEPPLVSAAQSERRSTIHESKGS